MYARIHRRSFIFTFVVCLLTTLLAAGYLIRWGREDVIATTSVSMLAAVSTTGMLINGMSIWRER